MKSPWVLFLFPLLASCMVPLGYNGNRAQGLVSDSPSAQYLQLSMEYWKQGRAAREAAGNDEQTLAPVLKSLGDEFQTKVDRLSAGASDDQEYDLGDDSGIPKKTLAGIALGEVLQASSRGKGASEVQVSLEKEYLRVLEATGEGRGLYLTTQSIWPENTVRYRWATATNPSPEHREALKAAMDDWTRGTGGRVRFQELEDSLWENFQLTIGVQGCIVLQDAVLEPGVTGRATVGYQCGSVFGYLKLSSALPPGRGLRRTSLHELGHVLGLLHEHKRPDRDQWIDVASGGYGGNETDLARVDEYAENLRWGAVQVRLGPWSITLYYPVWWKQKNAELVGPFDIHSVMIYSGFLTKQAWVDPADGTVVPAGSVVPWNTFLSPEDLATAMSLYR